MTCSGRCHFWKVTDGRSSFHRKRLSPRSSNVVCSSRASLPGSGSLCSAGWSGRAGETYDAPACCSVCYTIDKVTFCLPVSLCVLSPANQHTQRTFPFKKRSLRTMSQLPQVSQQAGMLQKTTLAFSGEISAKVCVPFVPSVPCGKVLLRYYR